jgi:hypothetical protein
MLKIIKDGLSSYLLVMDKLDRKFKIKRIFFLNAERKILRGDHAHKKCTQAFFSVRGNFYIECIYQNGNKKKINIKPGKKLEIIKPLTWVKVYLKKDNICGVLCDRYYEERDYIRDYKKFNATKNRI